MRRFLRPVAGLVLITLVGAVGSPAVARQGEAPEGVPADAGVLERAPAATPAPPPATLQPPPDVSLTLAHVERLQMEIADLTEQRRQFGIAGPIVALSVGGVMLTYGLLGLLMMSEGCGYEGECSTGLKTLVGALTVGGLVATVLGATTLSERVRERRRLGYDINMRKQELNLLQNRLRWNVTLTSQLQAATVGIVF